MSLRTWILDRLRPILGSDEIDPSSLVELTRVKPYEVPAIQAALIQSDIASELTESFDAVTASDWTHVLVAQANFEDGLNVLADLRGR